MSEPRIPGRCPGSIKYVFWFRTCFRIFAISIPMDLAEGSKPNPKDLLASFKRLKKLSNSIFAEAPFLDISPAADAVPSIKIFKRVEVFRILTHTHSSFLSRRENAIRTPSPLQKHGGVHGEEIGELQGHPFTQAVLASEDFGDCRLANVGVFCECGLC